MMILMSRSQIISNWERTECDAETRQDILKQDSPWHPIYRPIHARTHYPPLLSAARLRSRVPPWMVLQGAAAMTSGWNLFIPFFSDLFILPTAISLPSCHKAYAAVFRSFPSVSPSDHCHSFYLLPAGSFAADVLSGIFFDAAQCALIWHPFFVKDNRFCKKRTKT